MVQKKATRPRSPTVRGAGADRRLPFESAWRRLAEGGPPTVVEVDPTTGGGLVAPARARGARAELLPPKALRDRAREILAGLARGLS